MSKELEEFAKNAAEVAKKVSIQHQAFTQQGFTQQQADRFMAAILSSAQVSMPSFVLSSSGGSGGSMH